LGAVKNPESHYLTGRDDTFGVKRHRPTIDEIELTKYMYT